MSLFLSVHCLVLITQRNVCTQDSFKVAEHLTVNMQRITWLVKCELKSMNLAGIQTKFYKLCIGTYHDSFPTPWLQNHDFQGNLGSFRDPTASGYRMGLHAMKLSIPRLVFDMHAASTVPKIPVMSHILSFAIIFYVRWLNSSTLELNARSQSLF